MKKVIDCIPDIKKVIYSNPVTIIVWKDGTKTKSRCDESDVYDELTGFMLCVFKKVLTPKFMRETFRDCVYNVDSKKIKWNSSPTWLKGQEENVVRGTMNDKAIVEDMESFLSWLDEIWEKHAF